MLNSVEASNVTRTYFKRGKKDKIALDNVSLNIPKGSFYGLLGPNGAGKSTLIRIFSTLLLPSKGKVSVLGYDVKTQASEIRWKISLVAVGKCLDTDFLLSMNNFGCLQCLMDLPIKKQK